MLFLNNNFCDIIDQDTILLNDYIGFIYKITFASGEYYIGQKSFTKGVSWKKYKSSSLDVKSKIKNGESYHLEVLEFCDSKLLYHETRYMFKFNVIEDKMSLNKHILNKFYKKY